MTSKWFARTVLFIILLPITVLAVVLCWPLPAIAWLCERSGLDATKDGWVFPIIYVFVQIVWILFLMTLTVQIEGKL
jgi:hypothetical protein